MNDTDIRNGGTVSDFEPREENSDKYKRRKNGKKQQLVSGSENAPKKRRTSDSARDPDIEEEQATISEPEPWSEEEQKVLLESVDKRLPAKDKMPFGRRFKRLNWNEISDEIADDTGRTAEECEQKFFCIISQVRDYRILREVVNDCLESKAKLRNKRRRALARYDPRRPKLPRNSWLIFRSELWPSIHKRHPSWDFAKVGKHFSKIFTKLPSEEVERLKIAAQVERKPYEIDLAEFHNLPDYCPKERKVVATDKRKGYPRLPKTPFDAFCDRKGNYEENDEAHRAWKELDKDSRAIFIHEALDDARRYNEEVTHFMEQHPDMVESTRLKQQAARSISQMERLVIYSVDGSDPTVRPAPPPVKDNGYLLFCAEFYETFTLAGQKSKKWMESAAAKWKTLSVSAKSSYKKRIADIWKEYRPVAESYLKTLPVEERKTERKLLQLGRKKLTTEQQATVSENASLPASVQVKVRTKVARARLTNMTKMDGKMVFVFENEREYRYRFSTLSEELIRDRLEQMYDDLPPDARTGYEDRARRMEDQF